MEEHTIESLTERLARAERHKRVWRAVSIVLLALGVFLVLLIGFAKKCG